ncbi:hypothetical protein JQ634_34275 [Bradyrhizobium sp. AUGA SZCCT0240]|jgi:hypothetical protein|uniref:hypothetical protein n=1 Tax=unclassified Bradyrhizobium TaxID=2631580 RepID=UPI001BA834F9|nr:MULTISPECIES: hypothetical protein [unclassified Bradyrhizobium]MBR1193868.1 hypothetical protein [Bradyrhizobium sp. AUGA SZCCT0160]MBR1200789.1 hypothetical protein [Bradyrhizobium sp. AUGA SZCCT0158]MBR1245171.1 hypothetical protein [Bradyrhizobium sp. AUGA SZCCT0274]MBR1258719.1 hypothetical protein [Bradyrhizobium sp. AUGA SZCCT0240]
MNLLVTGAGAIASAVALPSSSLAAPSRVRDAVEVATSAVEPEGRVPSMAELRSWPFDYGSFPEYPPEIFGKLPEGFVLEDQGIEIHCFGTARLSTSLADR